MPHGILKFNANVLALEKEGRWKTAAELAYKQWVSEPNNINHLCCAGTEIWCALLEMEYYKFAPIDTTGMEFDDSGEMQVLLWKVASYGEKHFAENAIFNAYFGHMHVVMPFFFYGYNGDYTGWKEQGLRMMCKAKELDPDNLFAVAMAYSNGEPRDFANACRDFWLQITPAQWGTGEVAQYFFYILNGPVFYPHAYKNS